MLNIEKTLSMPRKVDWPRVNVEIHQEGDHLRLQVAIDIVYDYLVCS